MRRTAVLLMGPTAAGKTDIAIRLLKRFPMDIISVDSAMVYRGMDIGTAKPDAQTLARAPHRLIDIRDPEESYSAGEFVRDARQAIDDIAGQGRIPLLVGGTMMYFRALTAGIAELPAADPALRAAIDAQAARDGWPAVHAELLDVDPQAAARINPNDSQRIQRALEVFRATGRSLTDWQRASAGAACDRRFLKIALAVEPRKRLHERIEQRLDQMLAEGFVEELEALRRRPGLSRDCPAMRSVGYRQFWGGLDGEYSLEEARDRALYATRQLAKRQITWLRSESPDISVDALESGAIATISGFLVRNLA